MSYTHQQTRISGNAGLLLGGGEVCDSIRGRGSGDEFVGTMEVVLLLEDGEDGEVGITSGGPGDVTGGGGIYLRCVHFCIEPELLG